MGKKGRPTNEEVERRNKLGPPPGFDPESQAAIDVVNLEKLEERRALAKTENEKKRQLEFYTDGLPYDLNRVIDKAKSYLYRSFADMVEFGKCLIWIQEKQTSSAADALLVSFEQIIRTHLANVSRRTIFNAMRLARVAVEHPKLQHLTDKHYTKVIALLEILDEDDLKEFEESKEVAGITIDEFEKIPRRQLTEELRRYKKKVEAGTEQLTEAEKKITDLKAQIHDLQNPKLYSSEEEKYLDIIKKAGMDFEVVMFNLKSQIPYAKEQIPQTVLTKLYLLFCYFHRVVQWDREELMPHWEGVEEEIPWEPGQEDMPSLDALKLHMPHLQQVIKRVQARKERMAAKRGARRDETERQYS